MGTPDILAKILYFYQFIFPASYADFFCMFHTGFPVGIRVCDVEMIPFLPMAFVFMEHAPGNNGLAVAGIGAGNVYRYRVKGCKHAYIRDNWDIVFRMAVTVW